MTNVKILVCCHKKDVVVTQTPYFPIHVGKALSKVNLGIPGDNTGNNISFKNSSYCELTGMYWAWQNLMDADVIGLCHYRRYFDFHNQCHQLFPTTEFPVSHFENMDFSVPEEIIVKVQNGSVVVPKHLTTFPLYIQYNNLHYSDDLRLLGNVIRNCSDEKMYNAYIETIFKNNKIHPFNMFIMNRTMYNDYCSWLFSILEEVEKQLDISHYSDYQKRVFGFMAERLFNVFIKKCGISKMELPVISFSGMKQYNFVGSIPKFYLRNIALNSINFLAKNRIFVE